MPAATKEPGFAAISNDDSATESTMAGFAVGGGANYEATVAPVVRRILENMPVEISCLWPNPNPVANHVTSQYFDDIYEKFRSPEFLELSSP